MQTWFLHYGVQIHMVKYGWQIFNFPFLNLRIRENGVTKLKVKINNANLLGLYIIAALY